MRALRRTLVLGTLVGVSAVGVEAQDPTLVEACYVPDVGAIYLINLAGLPTACLDTSHVAISWSAGALADGSVTAVHLADGAVLTLAIADGAVTDAKLGFDPATQAELDAHGGSTDHDGRYFTESELSTAGTINAVDNPVNWTKLVGVPAGFADGVDNTGGTPSDLVCVGCVETTDLADAAVTEGKLGFDPATQAELTAHAGSGEHDGRYFTEAELSTTGTINTSGNPVDWSKLYNVPAGFADGVDDDGGTPSDLVCVGCVGSTDLEDGSVTEVELGFDPATQAELTTHAGSGDHDGRYFTESELSTAGTINTVGNPVDWSKLYNVPAGFADGVDNDVTDHGGLTGLADDDHAQYMLFDGVRAATDGFAVTGTFASGAIPATGAGVRMMWYPGKGAFRAGAISGTQWDDASVGAYSMAMGSGVTASGISSIALGLNSEASGDWATALGYATTASGDYGTAMGQSTTTSGQAGTAMGYVTAATGNYATALGESTTAQARGSVVLGSYNVLAGSPTGFLTTDPILVAGNGTSSGSRSNALTLLRDGNLTIAGTLTESSDIRLKEEVEPVEATLAGVLSLTPIRYRFRSGTGHPSDRQIGLSAQEVERFFPELVRRDSEGYLSVAYTDLAAVLVRALQEQQREIEELEARVTRLEDVVGERR